MYCPQCSQPVVGETQFCARCGVRLEGFRRLLATGGELLKSDEAKPAPALSERQKGVRQGAKLLLCLVLLPLHFVLEGLLPSVENTNLDELPQFVFDALLSVVMLAGLARILYAVTLERGAAKEFEESDDEARAPALDAAGGRAALPPTRGVPVTDFTFGRANTAEVAARPSVTERTTSLLDER